MLLSRSPRNITLLVSSTLTVMAGAIIASALPEISRAFGHLARAELLSKLLLTVPALATALLAPVAGYLADRSGRRRLLLASLLLYALAGTTGAYLDNIYMILVGRAFLGVAVGGLMTAVVTLIGDYFQGEERSRFMGYQAAFAGLGGMLFITGGGLLTDISWRAPFWIYGLSLLVWLLARRWIPEPARGTGQEPRPATAEAPAPGRDPVPGTTAGAFTGQASLLPLLRQVPGAVWMVYLVAFFSMSVFYMVPVQMPFMLGALEGVSNARIGMAIAFMNITSVPMALSYGRIKRRLPYAGVMALVYLLVAAGYLIISQGQTYASMVLGILVAGAGFGLQMANINLWLVSLAPLDFRGRLVGYLNAIIFLGMFLSPVLLHPLVGEGPLHRGFLLVALLLLALSIVFALMARRQGRAHRGRGPRPPVS